MTDEEFLRIVTDFFEDTPTKRHGPLADVIRLKALISIGIHLIWVKPVKIDHFSGVEIKDLKIDEKQLVKIEAIINSMTKKERRNHHIMNASRRRRIARGSGTRVKDVNQLLKRYVMSSKMIKKFQRTGLRGLPKELLPGI